MCLCSCLYKKYPTRLPATSIVIVFHNEAWSTLIRTVWSVINRSPRALVEEIILVDDASEREWLGGQLEDYVKTLPVKTFVLRSPKRYGIVYARLLGVNNAKVGYQQISGFFQKKILQGPVITFLDSHCECNLGWLEPLLSRVAYDRSIVACPTIDSISYDTFGYKRFRDNVWGGFNWILKFDWYEEQFRFRKADVYKLVDARYEVPDREHQRRDYDKTAPLWTPVMAGGLFSIDKAFFYEIGAYDPGMVIWGSENLEMSFRVSLLLIS